MTYTIIAPNANQSPGLFPVQNNTNFQRLRDIINNDHNFLDTAATNQGIHNQVSMINRTVPGSLPAGYNGIMWSGLDANAESQLNWYNGVTNYAITPSFPAPQRFTGSVIVTAGSTSSPIFTTLVNCQGTIFVNYSVGNIYTYYMFFKSGSTFQVVQLAQSIAAGRPPTVIASSSTELETENNSLSTKTISYFIMVDFI